MRALSSRRDSSLWNEDLAPVPLNSRTWNRWHFAALWVGMCICIPSYMLAASLMKEGMYWWQALLTITLGNLKTYSDATVSMPMAEAALTGAQYRPWHWASCRMFRAFYRRPQMGQFRCRLYFRRFTLMPGS